MNYAIILSGGVGTRLGLDIPKQYFEVNQKPIIRYVIEAFDGPIKLRHSGYTYEFGGQRIRLL